MSYDILYNTLFITDGTYLVALVEEGPSNVYTHDSKKRIRDWYPVRFNTYVPTTLEALLLDTAQARQSTDYTEYLKYRGNFISYHTYLTLIERSAKKALTIAQARKRGIQQIYMKFSQWNPIYEDVLHSTSTPILSGDSLAKYAQDIKHAIDNKVRAQHSWGATVTRVPAQKKVRKERTESYVIMNYAGLYAAYVKQHMLFFYRSIHNAKQFASRKSALAYIERMGSALKGAMLLKIDKDYHTISTEEIGGTR